MSRNTMVWVVTLMFAVMWFIIGVVYSKDSTPLFIVSFINANTWVVGAMIITALGNKRENP